MSLSGHIEPIVESLPSSGDRPHPHGAGLLGQTTVPVVREIVEADVSTAVCVKFFYASMMRVLLTVGRFVDNTAADSELEEISSIKRLLEWLTADRQLHEDLYTDGAAVAERLGQALDPQAVRHLWDPHWTGEQSDITRRFFALIQEQATPVDDDIDLAPGHPRLSIWRKRQMARCGWEVPASLGGMMHPPLSIELSKGCSVGCWFCGVSALKFAGTWPYSDDNAVLWRGMMTELSSVLGSVRADGFLYWATDPLDNADYEHFCLDHTNIMGRSPQTTTALSLKNVERTRALLKLSRARGCQVDRFSLLTMGHVRKVMQSFTALELLHVELVMQNPESVQKRSNAGRARVKASERGEEVRDDAPTACVSGYVINTVEHTIQLVTPCRPTDDIPMGYHVVFNSHYDTLAEFTAQIQAMAQQVPTSLSRSQVAAFPGFLEFNTIDGGFEVSSSRSRTTFTNAQYGPMQELGRLIHGGDQGCGQIAMALKDQSTPSMTMYVLEQLFKQGLLQETFKPISL